MFGNRYSPYRRRTRAQRRLNRISRKRDRLDEYQYSTFDYEGKRKRLNRKMASAISDKQLAEYEIKHPAPAPKIQDNSRRTTITANVKVNSENKKGVNDAFNSNKIGKTTKNSKKKTATPKEGKKKSKAKMIFFCIVAVLVAAGLIALTVRITNCVRDNQDNSSNTYSAITI